ncbi:MAG TPA: hypothetical protein QGF05_02765 [Dehalococcoidia bacterium]|nr:hypothetical protein [Dehalococcoidia bacterium]
MVSDPITADGSQLTNRLLAKLYVAQHRHLHGAIVDLVQIGVPLAEVAVVVGMTENEVQQILDEAAELASRAIGRPPPGAGPPSTGNSPPS